MRSNDPISSAAVAAIQTGDVAALTSVILAHPEIVNARIDGQRTLLHVATDWPGNYPNGAEIVAALIASGADVNSRFIGKHSETPLHWAASCDDIAVIDVLLNHGADIEADGAVIGGGTPLADAVAFGQWQAARKLVARGAATTLWQAAALGLMPQVSQHFTKNPAPPDAEITKAFWCACHGGQQEAALYLASRGADINWIGYDGLSPLDAARRSEAAAGMVEWLLEIGARPAAQKS